MTVLMIVIPRFFFNRLVVANLILTFASGKSYTLRL